MPWTDKVSSTPNTHPVTDLRNLQPTLRHAAHTLTHSEIDYGLQGQINIKLAKVSGETNSARSKRAANLAKTLVEIEGVQPDTVKASGERVIVENPGHNIQYILRALNLTEEQLRFGPKSPPSEPADLRAVGIAASAAVENVTTTLGAFDQVRKQMIGKLASGGPRRDETGNSIC